MPDPAGAQARAAAEDVARRSYGKLVAYLSARTRDVAGAEDALADALAAALTDWPAHGVPDNPEAWLMAVAKRRIIDRRRRETTAVEAVGQLQLIADEIMSEADTAGEIPDRRLALMFACAHPAIESSARAPLILQTILGFDAATIAAAFLVSPAAMGQRLARAKAKMRVAGIPFRVPETTELADRLDTVLEAIYAAYAEGWSDPGGIDPRRRELAGEAVWLGRLVVALLPEAPEALGLLALMLYLESRRAARRDSTGGYVPLSAQDTRAWDAGMIAEAEASLVRANALPGSGRYQIEAAIQSAHTVRRSAGAADWPAILSLYDALIALTGSNVAAVNRAVALGEVEGPEAGLAALDALAADDQMRAFQPYYAARADLLARCGNAVAAEDAYRQATALETDPAALAFLKSRLSRTAVN
jgi:RNA polymerase sigma-70 factor (ECF subfamily)